MNSTLLTITDLSWHVPEKQILNNISFDIKSSEVIGIIGPNGAGKTSLLNCILNHQKNYIGHVYFQQKNIKQYSTKILAQYFALVAQKTSAIFSLTVRDIVVMGLLPHKSLFALNSEKDIQQVNEALEKVGLLSSINQTFNLLSGGEQQRVLIARALVQKPKILILDEPTNHLDIYYQHQILKLVTSLGITVLMTVHDLNLASQYCQRLLLLNKGKLIADNTPEKVLTPTLLSSVFSLPCVVEKSPSINNNAVRVYFSSIPLENNDQIAEGNKKQKVNIHD